MNNSTLAPVLREILFSAKEALLKLSDLESSHRPSPEKWSKKQILGHLIDSAANNHQRFVRGQLKADMIFQGYAQAEWVDLQDYQHRKWSALVELFFNYNLHLAYIMEKMPDAIRFRAVSSHNLHQIASKRISEGETTSLEYFMWDYVAHLEHHLGQLLEGYQKRLGPYENDFHKG